MVETRTDKKKVVYAPIPYSSVTTGLMSVALTSNEQVDWIWFENMIIGYVIVNKAYKAANVTQY